MSLAGGSIRRQFRSQHIGHDVSPVRYTLMYVGLPAPSA
jgi:hypothetical protein